MQFLGRIAHFCRRVGFARCGVGFRLAFQGSANVTMDDRAVVVELILARSQHESAPARISLLIECIQPWPDVLAGFVRQRRLEQGKNGILRIPQGGVRAAQAAYISPSPGENRSCCRSASIASRGSPNLKRTSPSFR